MAQYMIGDRVRATETAQGMARGQIYEVVRVEEQVTPFGNFVTYFLCGSERSESFPVGNLHLLSERGPALLRALNVPL